MPSQGIDETREILFDVRAEREGHRRHREVPLREVLLDGRAPLPGEIEAELAVGCLHEDGLLAEGDVWRQESVLGGVYEASVQRRGGVLVPTVKGRAWITAESELRFAADDPHRAGITL